MEAGQAVFPGHRVVAYYLSTMRASTGAGGTPIARFVYTFDWSRVTRVASRIGL